MVTGISREDILNLTGEFTWFWGKYFFVETNIGNFIWSDPDYGDGDNTFTKTDMTYKQFCDAYNYPYGRDKGTHVIKDYCGDMIQIVGV